MASVSLTFTDTDQAIGRYVVNLDVVDAQTDDGFASGAHVTGLYIIEAIGFEQFNEGCAAYGRAKGFALRDTDPTVATLTIKDIDLDSGQIEVTLETDVEPLIDQSASAAFMAASFIKDAMGSPDFAQGCLEFAHRLAAKIGNEAVVNDNIAKAA